MNPGFKERKPAGQAEEMRETRWAVLEWLRENGDDLDTDDDSDE